MYEDSNSVVPIWSISAWSIFTEFPKYIDQLGTMRKSTILGHGSEVPGWPPGPRGPRAGPCAALGAGSALQSRVPIWEFCKNNPCRSNTWVPKWATLLVPKLYILIKLTIQKSTLTGIDNFGTPNNFYTIFVMCLGSLSEPPVDFFQKPG